MDVDGDLIGLCDEVEVCFAEVPVYSNLAAADLGSDISGLRKVGRLRHAGFSECVADAIRGIVWASSRSGIVRAFSANVSDENSRQVAQLNFGEREKLGCRGKLGGRTFGICRVGDCIVGSGSSPQLSVWNIKQVLDSYETSGCNNESNRGYNGSAPSLIQVEGDSTKFQCGDVTWIGGSNLLIGGARSYDRDLPSVRHFDIQKEKIVGLYCGLKGGTSLEKQHCVERFHSIFVADAHASYVYDTRTFKPCLVLETKHLQGQILGVPGEAAMTAFAFSSRDQEEIQCWDLRMPASHAYSMWTGNSNITSLFWHESSASLIASTQVPTTSIWIPSIIWMKGTIGPSKQSMIQISLEIVVCVITLTTLPLFNTPLLMENQ